MSRFIYGNRKDQGNRWDLIRPGGSNPPFLKEARRRKRIKEPMKDEWWRGGGHGRTEFSFSNLTPFNQKHDYRLKTSFLWKPNFPISKNKEIRRNQRTWNWNIPETDAMMDITWYCMLKKDFRSQKGRCNNKELHALTLSFRTKNFNNIIIIINDNNNNNNNNNYNIASNKNNMASNNKAR